MSNDVATQDPKKTQFPVDMEVEHTEAEIRESYQEAAYILFDTEPFLYHILGAFRLDLKNKDVPVAGTTLRRKGPILYLNSPFAEFHVADRVAIIKHEAMHILWGHIPRTKHYMQCYKGTFEEGSIARAMNVAQDLAINQKCMINGLSKDNSPFYEFGCFPEKEEFGFPEDLSSDEYFKLMKDKQEKNGGFPQIGSHDWRDAEEGEADGEGNEPMSAEEAGALNKAIVDRAKNETIKSHGSVSQDYMEILDKIYGRKGIQWRNTLRMTLATEAHAGKQASWKRPNRRQLKNTKGTIKLPKKKIGVVADVSGSMGNKEVQWAFNEVDALSTKAEVYLIQADTEVKKATKWRKGMDWARMGCGGTYMGPAFDYLVGHKFNTIICITDGYMDFPPEVDGVNVIWVSTTDVNYPYGKVIRITDSSSWWER